MFSYESSMVSANGLPDRRREINISNWVIGLSLGYLLASFLVPALLPTGSVPELSGRANTLDYVWKDASWGDWGNEPHSENASMGHDQAQHGGKFAWSELDLFSAFVYGFGDLNCHQKHERSWKINENQMPVCTRDIGIFAGIFVGGVIFRKRGLNRWTIRDSIISVLPDEKVEPFYFNDRRFLLAFGGIALLLLPTALDGGIQAVSGYESTNLKRLITGFPMGIGVGLLFAGVFAANPKPFEFDAGRVILPANARLVPSVEPTDDKTSEIATQTETDTTAGDSEE
jgi:uncharacterized membrane protein